MRYLDDTNSFSRIAWNSIKKEQLFDLRLPLKQTYIHRIVLNYIPKNQTKLAIHGELHETRQSFLFLVNIELEYWNIKLIRET